MAFYNLDASMGRITRRGSAQIGKQGRAGIDTWLIRAAHASQVVLLGFAIFGYFYTVRPIHQKEVLDEEIAQKRIELRDKEREAKELAASIVAKTKELNEKEGKLTTARSEARAARSEAQQTYDALRTEYLGTVTSAFTSCAQVALDKDLDGSELKMCPAKTLESTDYLLSRLKTKDRELLSKLVRDAAKRAEAPFAAVVERQKNRLQQLKAQMGEVQKQIDEARAQHSGGVADPAARLKATSSELQLVLKLNELRAQQRNIRFDTFREFDKVLEPEASKIRDKF